MPRAGRLSRRRRQRRGAARAPAPVRRSWARPSRARSWASPSRTVGLLSIGEEPDQGHAGRDRGAPAHRRRPAHRDFYGNVEGRDIMNRLVDVIVTDGFTGNVGLKTIEGSAKAILGALQGHDRCRPPRRSSAACLLQHDLRCACAPPSTRRSSAARCCVGMNAAGRHRPRQLQGAGHRPGRPHGPARRRRATCCPTHRRASLGRSGRRRCRLSANSPRRFTA